MGGFTSPLKSEAASARNTPPPKPHQSVEEQIMIENDDVIATIPTSATSISTVSHSSSDIHIVLPTTPSTQNDNKLLCEFHLYLNLQLRQGIPCQLFPAHVLSGIWSVVKMKKQPYTVFYQLYYNEVGVKNFPS